MPHLSMGYIKTQGNWHGTLRNFSFPCKLDKIHREIHLDWEEELINCSSFSFYSGTKICTRYFSLIKTWNLMVLFPIFF
jgi:hypothetical protein